MIPFTNHRGEPDAMSYAEAHSAGRTHSHLSYALGVTPLGGSPKRYTEDREFARWTPEEDLWLLMHPDLTRAEAAAALGRTYASIKLRRRKLRRR